MSRRESITNEDTMDYQPIKSGNLEGAKYDPAAKKLTVKFKGGSEYEYDEVPEDVWKNFSATFQADDSTGKFFHQHIKKFKFTKIEKNA